MKKIFSIVVMFVVVVMFFTQITVSVFAAVEQTGSGASSVPQSGGGLTPTESTIKNPLKVNSIEEFISIALNAVVNMLAIAAVCYIMWAGFLFVKAQGNPDELTKAKTALLHALIGTALVLGAWGLATIISNTVNKVTNNNNVVLKPIKP